MKRETIESWLCLLSLYCLILKNIVPNEYSVKIRCLNPHYTTVNMLYKIEVYKTICKMLRKKHSVTKRFNCIFTRPLVTKRLLSMWQTTLGAVPGCCTEGEWYAGISALFLEIWIPSMAVGRIAVAAICWFCSAQKASSGLSLCLIGSTFPETNVRSVGKQSESGGFSARTAVLSEDENCPLGPRLMLFDLDADPM